MGTLSRKEKERLIEKEIEYEIYEYLPNYLNFNYESKLIIVTSDVFQSFLQVQEQIRKISGAKKDKDYDLFVMGEYEKHESGIWVGEIVKFVKLVEDSRLRRMCIYLSHYANKYSNNKRFSDLVGIEFNKELEIYKFVLVILCNYFDNFDKKKFNDLLRNNGLK